jgi:3-oxoacyl-[acyl-carrier protein] reductase
MMPSITRRVAIVSGGSGGLGLEIVRQFIDNGLNAVICSSGKEKGEAAKAMLTPVQQEHCLAVGCNCSDPDAVQKMIKETLELFGGIDVLVNGAGVHDRLPFGKIPVDELGKIFGSSVFGTMVMIQEMIPYLEKAVDPRIINLVTIDGRNGGIEGGAGMAAAKSAQIGLTKNAAKQLAPLGITVNAIAYGVIEGDVPEPRSPDDITSLAAQIPLGRLGNPKDIAPLACFLAGAGSAYITGTIIDVNGGLFIA